MICAKGTHNILWFFSKTDHNLLFLFIKICYTNLVVLFLKLFNDFVRGK